MSLANEIPELPDEYLVEIGRVTTRWAFLESIVDLSLIKLAGKDIHESRSYIIFNHMSFPMKLDVMGALVSELLPDYPKLSGFKSVHQSLKRAQELRNSIIHSKVDSRTKKPASLKPLGSPPEGN